MKTCDNCGAEGYLTPTNAGEACLVCGHETPRPPKPRFKVRRVVMKGRASPHAGRRLFVSGGQAAENPYRPGTKSANTFALLTSHPGIIFEQALARGARQRTLTEMIRIGRARAVAPDEA